VLEADDKSNKIGRYYLESNNWDMELAAKEYKNDLKFDS
jgi:hypothetical protein